MSDDIRVWWSCGLGAQIMLVGSQYYWTEVHLLQKDKGLLEGNKFYSRAGTHGEGPPHMSTPPFPYSILGNSGMFKTYMEGQEGQ